MEITPEIITMVVTAFITWLLGLLAKKYEWKTEDYIPLQNAIIGVLAGVIIYLTGLNTNMLNAIITGIFSAMTAGGMYDLTKTGKWFRYSRNTGRKDKFLPVFLKEKERKIEYEDND